MRLNFRTYSPKNQTGLTLVELVVAIIIMGVIGLIISNFMGNSVNAFLSTKNNITALQKTHLIDSRLEAELKEVNHNGTSYDINTAFSSTSLTFTNIDTTTTVEINYDGASNTLKLDYTSPAVTILSDGVSAFSLSYFQADGTTSSTPGAVSEIVFIQYDYTISENGVSYVSTGRVFLRDRQ